MRNSEGDLLLYPTANGSFYGGGGPIKVGHGWHFTHYFVGNWSGDGKPDLLVRNSDGDLLLYPFVNGSFYGGGGPIKVGNGWHFTHYFVGDWAGDGRPDLLVRNSAGDLLVYPFVNGSFYGGGGPIQVGNGWHFTDYFVANWTGDARPDLIVRNSQGDLLLYPFVNGTFYGGGGPIQVGNGWNFTHYFVADWTLDGVPDLLVRASNGDLLLYPFENGTFYSGTQCSTPPYAPAYWNDGSTVQRNNNCYNYANNKRTDTFAQPGRASGHMYQYLNCADVTNGATWDGLEPTTATAQPTDGKTKIALVMWPNRDYHWYRLDEGGQWSHKPGSTRATNLDNAGRVITNPETADRGPYTVFCGYFFTCSDVNQGQGHANIR